MATSAIAATCASEFGIGERQVWRYIRKVYDWWAEEEQANRAITRHRRTRFLERVAHEAYSNGEYNASIAALKQLCRIEGLEQLGVKLQHTLEARAELSIENSFDHMTSHEKRKQLAQLMEKRARTIGPNGIDAEIKWLCLIKKKLEAGDDDWETARVWQRHRSVR